MWLCPVYGLAQNVPLAVKQEEPSARTPSSLDATSLDTVVVTGIRGDIQAAQTVKRDAVQIVDSIVSQDVEKLPDVTATVVLARVPGIQVRRSRGQATDMLLRGLPNLISTYNGREIYGADSRTFPYQDLGAGAIAGLDVYKSGSADLIEGGIAGSINIRSRRPFDFAGQRIAGHYRQTLSDQADKYRYNFNLLYSTRWQTGMGEMGFLLNAAKYRIPYLDSFRENGPNMGYRQAEDQPDQPAFIFPDYEGIFFNEGENSRPTYNAAFQWRPNEHWDIGIDALFLGMRGKYNDRWLVVPLWDEGVQFSNVVTVPGGRAPRAISATATGGLRPEGFQSVGEGRADTYSFGIGATYTNDAWQWSFDIASNNSRYRQVSFNIDHAYISTPVRDLLFNIQGGRAGSSVRLRDFDPLDPNNYLFRGLYENYSRSSGRDLQYRTDLKFIPQEGVITAIQAGVRGSSRDADSHFIDTYVYTEPDGLPLASLPIDFINSEPGFDGDRNAPFPLRGWFTPDHKSVRRNRDQLRTLVGRPEGGLSPEFPAFEGKEKAQAAYGQIHYEFAPGILIDGLLGLRVVKTQTDMSGLYTDQQVSEWRTRRNTYTDYLPNASMRLRFSDQLQLRLAATKTRTRADFGQLNASITRGSPSTICVTDPGNANCIIFSNSGNPELDPIRSTNYDMSLEYYFSNTGSVSAALFRRNVTGFIFSMTADRQDPEGIYNLVRHDQPENAGKGRLQGVEVSFSAFLNWDQLPEWTKAFGMQTNYTYIDHCTELNPFLAESMPGCVRIPGVAKNAYNLVLIYERPVFAARMAYNWHAKETWFHRQWDPIAGETGPTLPEDIDDYGTLDFSIRYAPKKSKLSFSFDASNLLRRQVKSVRQVNLEGDIYPYRVAAQERVWSLGIQFNF